MRQATPAGGAPLCDLFLPLVAWREDVKWAVFAAHNYDRASGSWHRQEVPCPDFGEWWNTAVGLQGGYPPLGRFAEPLDVYGERIRTLSETEWPEGFAPPTGGGGSNQCLVARVALARCILRRQGLCFNVFVWRLAACAFGLRLRTVCRRGFTFES